jgi:tetratricopeptide (TPR) repeat protein
MSDDVRALTAALAADPGSLVFLELGEVLRRRGQSAAALKVAQAGAARYPALADARDLCARIHSDLGDGESAFDAWMEALQLDPTHLGAHKGLGFLYYRAGDFRRARRHLEIAVTRSDEAGLHAAIARVRGAAAAETAQGGPVAPEAPDRGGAPLGHPAHPADQPESGIPFSMDEDEPGSALPPESELFAGFEGAREGLLLLDQNGLRLGGGLRDRDGVDVADAVSAHLAGVSRESGRAARLLELGAWQSLAVECGDGNLHLSAPSADTVLLTVRDASVPAGRLAILADRASQAARRWLERLA